jgi:hypothetical protein
MQFQYYSFIYTVSMYTLETHATMRKYGKYGIWRK